MIPHPSVALPNQAGREMQEINAKRESALIEERRPRGARARTQLCTTACQYLSRYIKRTARDQLGTGSQKKRGGQRARRKMRSNRGNNVAKSCANSTNTRAVAPCCSRLATHRRYFIEKISPPSVPLPARGSLQVLSVVKQHRWHGASRRQLKGHP